ncbi:MAG: hypothetical protein AVDCRST_MAG04-1614, partial [uncultured Acetobacteraceae bacterium]
AEGDSGAGFGAGLSARRPGMPLRDRRHAGRVRALGPRSVVRRPEPLARSPVLARPVAARRRRAARRRNGRLVAPLLPQARRGRRSAAARGHPHQRAHASGRVPHHPRAGREGIRLPHRQHDL